MHLPSLLQRRSIYLSLLLSLSLFLSLSLTAQPRPLGSWNIINAKLKLNSKWSVWTEGQLRSTAFFDNFFYYEAKLGATYNLNKAIALTGGFGHYETYTTGGNFQQPLVTSENRTWLQLAMEQQLGRINFDHRYRVEQRHLSTGYKNRYRYRLNVVIPINHAEMKPTTLYTYFGDEIFFTDKAPFYERNRFYAGLGYKLSPLLALQSGYMRQFDYKLTSTTSRDFLQVMLLFSFHLAEHQEHSVPKTTD